MVLGGRLPDDIGARWLPFGDASRSYEVQMQVIDEHAVPSPALPTSRHAVPLPGFRTSSLLADQRVHPRFRTMALSSIPGPPSPTYPRQPILPRAIISAPSVLGGLALLGRPRASTRTIIATR
jgi:hypothetical protein